VTKNQKAKKMQQQTPTNATAPAAQPSAGQTAVPTNPAAAGAVIPAGAVPGAAQTARTQGGSLYIGDIDPEVGESHLFEIFSQVGPINTIRVCRDATTRRSLGYAYVNFREIRDAERALDTLNYSLIKNRPCRIMWCQRDPAFRRSGVGNVFIKNLDKEIENKSLYDTFSNFGNIVSCKVATDENGTSKGYGFIHYETKEAAEEAINTLNGMILNNKSVFVGHFKPRKDRKVISPEETFTNVYVKNLETSVNEEGLREMFGAFGQVTSAAIMKDQEGGSRCFGFVNFRNHEDAVKAVKALHGDKRGDKTLFVCRAQKKSERREQLAIEYGKRLRENQDKYQGLNLYVKNLDESVNDDRLREEFANYGTITSAKVMVDDSGAPRGFGFVCFSKADEAAKALAAMHGTLVFGKPLYVAYAQRREVRRAQLEAQYAQRQAQYYYQTTVPAAMFPPNTYPYPYPPQTRYPFQPPPPNQRGWTGQRAAGVGGPTQIVQGRPFPSLQNYPIGQRNNRNTRPPRITGQGQPMVPQTGTRNGPNNPRGGSAGPRFSGNPRRNPYPIQQAGGPTDPLDPKRLASMTVEERKRVIGDAMFEVIQQEQIDPDLAKKITGMILASNEDITELIHLLEDRTGLVEKVREALDVLRREPESESTQASVPPTTSA